MKTKTKKIKRSFVFSRFRAFSLLAVLLMSSFTVSTVVASKIYARQIDSNKLKQESALSQELASVKKIKPNSSYKFVPSETPKPVASSGVTAQPGSTTKSADAGTSATPKTSQATAQAKASAAASQPQPSAATSETASSLAFINSVRAAVGKPALTQNATMNQWALAHTQAQVASCGIYHQSLSPFLGKNIGPTTVHSIAENVGYAGSTIAVLNALKNSPGHYSNMIGDYQYVGIGVVTASGACAGYVYTTQLFAK